MGELKRDLISVRTKNESHDGVKNPASILSQCSGGRIKNRSSTAITEDGCSAK